MRKLKSIGSAIVLFVTTVFMSACLDTDPGFDEYGQWIKDVAAIDAYVDANDISVIRDAASGISIHITELGTAGLPPDLTNDLKVNYVGKYLSSGAVFDPGTTPWLCKLAACNLGGQVVSAIQGWQIALPMLPAGTKATLYIPSYYGYGNSGSGSIPPNANLIFDVHLESVQRIPEQVSKFTSDTTAISLFLKDSTSFVKYDSGIWYSVRQEGTGISPTSIYDKVKIKWTIKEMKTTGAITYYTDFTLEPSVSFSSRLVNLPPGVMIALQQMQEGERSTFYIPSALAFGSQGALSTPSGLPIPANANLIFEIELLEVVN
jgi:FKBP-type peptidyl-prolyl cis-trans isomerase